MAKKKKKVITTIPFGGDCPELGFSQKKWDETYGPNRPERTKELERHYERKMNEGRIKNGLSPIYRYT